MIQVGNLHEGLHEPQNYRPHLQSPFHCSLPKMHRITGLCCGGAMGIFIDAASGAALTASRAGVWGSTGGLKGTAGPTLALHARLA